MAFCISAVRVNGSILDSSGQFQPTISTTFKPAFNLLPKKIDLANIMKQTGRRLLDAFVNTTFRIVDQPLHPLQSNLAPVEEIEEAVEITCIDGKIPVDFPEGVYVRNGSNPVHGSLKSSKSILGKTSHVWIEGEGMLHATYFRKHPTGNWIVHYKNKYVESPTFKMEKQHNQFLFIPTLEGDPFAVLTANILNKLRLGTPSKHYQNVSMFEHSGKLYTGAENSPPQEVDASTLQSFDYLDLDASWNSRPCCSHPKKAPGSGELVTLSVDAEKPYFLVGVISADGKLVHTVDLKLDRAVLSHDIGVTQKYNVLIDHPLVLDLPGLIKGGSLIKFNKEGSARFGVMPRYGDADSVKWFDVEPHCTFHLFNCFEDGNEVVVRGCRCRESVIPGPAYGIDKFEWFSRGYNFTQINNIGNRTDEFGYLFHHVYLWRLNMATGEVKEKNLTGTDFSMDFPFINSEFTGLKHKYGYAQVIDSAASSASGLSKYGGLAKLYFDEETSTQSGEQIEQQQIKLEYHMFGDNIFCTGSVFVAKPGFLKEDDGWIITYLHNEETNLSQAYIIEAKNFSKKPVATINLPRRVPYGHHGIFVSMPGQV